MESIILHELENVVEGEVAKRPSKICKTPYVADVIINSVETLGAQSIARVLWSRRKRFKCDNVALTWYKKQMRISH